MASSDWLSRILYAIHDFLDVGQAPGAADCIFVFAGRPERKSYALELFRRGYAKRIIFSVGRFEWRGFLQLGLQQDGGLKELVQKTLPPKRHFFVYVDGQQAWCFGVKIGRLGTYSEARALSQFIRQQNIRSLIMVSTAFHLRRAYETLHLHCAEANPRIIPVAVPEHLASDQRAHWWGNRKMFFLIVSEYLKYFCYKLTHPFVALV